MSMRVGSLAVRLVAVIAVSLLGACRDEIGPIEPGGSGHIAIDSDPQGATIFVDGQSRGKVTPDTIHGLAGTREIMVRIDSAGASYGYRIQIVVPPDSVIRLTGPLALSRCNPDCPLVRENTASRIRFSHALGGPLFYRDGTGEGAFWPGTTGNSYISTGMPLFAAQVDDFNLAIGIYDNVYLIGRPFPRTSTNAGAFLLNQSFWVVPPLQRLEFATVRGLEVTEEVIGTAGIDDVIVLRLVFRNITNRPAYQAADPFIPAQGIRFENAFVGFALDPDIGTSEDDLYTYDPELNAMIAYDAAFREDGFTGASRTAPGLVGLRLLEAPAGARRVLNGWPRQIPGFGSGDWSAGTFSEENGWIILSGTDSYEPDHADNTIGHLPGTAANDYRIAVSAGPLTLAPGDSAVIRVALAFADPEPGTFTTGTVTDSGDPAVTNRPIMQVAAPLRARLRVAEGVR